MTKKADKNKPDKEYSLKELIDFTQHALISEDKNLQKKVWKYINCNEGMWPWIRAGILVRAYEAADAKGREEFCMINIQSLVEYKALKPLKKTFTDKETGIEYRQFKYKNGRIERIPMATEGMCKLAYDTALNKKFLGDYVTFHSSGQSEPVEEYILDTQEKVDDYNAGKWFKKWYIKDKEQSPSSK
ncbi:hypothetical protein GF360_02865 [candidate division WWE3 bacterium]|nr:hypothetical protein [candidate division WWE3 bacterium]